MKTVWIYLISQFRRLSITQKVLAVIGSILLGLLTDWFSIRIFDDPAADQVKAEKQTSILFKKLEERWDERDKVLLQEIERLNVGNQNTKAASDPEPDLKVKRQQEKLPEPEPETTASPTVTTQVKTSRPSIGEQEPEASTIVPASPVLESPVAEDIVSAPQMEQQSASLGPIQGLNSNSPTPLEQIKTDPYKQYSLAVFSDEEFELCGYSRFKAELSNSQIRLTSQDRSIPDIPFRGFEKKVPPETMTTLWPGCIVIAGYTKVSGTVRIGFSVREKKPQ